MRVHHIVGLWAVCLVLLLIPLRAASEDIPTQAPSADALNRLEQLAVLIDRIDENAERGAAGTIWRFKVRARTVTVVADLRADRMRIMVPIAPISLLSPELAQRLLQANFDTALDARYAVAQGLIWGTFIHPLTALSDDEFLSGLGQTVNIATTFGTTFQSGALTYGGGDSAAELGELLKDLLKKKDEKPV